MRLTAFTPCYPHQTSVERPHVTVVVAGLSLIFRGDGSLPVVVQKSRLTVRTLVYEAGLIHRGGA